MRTTIEATLLEMADFRPDNPLWVYDRHNETHSVIVGTITMNVTRGRNAVNALYSVSHEMEGLLCNDMPADNMTDGKFKAIEWARNWLNSRA